MKTKITENWSNWSHGPLPCLIQWNHEQSCRAIQDWWVMVESFDKTWSTREGNGKLLQYSCLENPIHSMKRQEDKTLKDELPRSVGAQYATGDQWINNWRKNEEMEPKQKQHLSGDVIGDGGKVWFCKEQYCIGTRNVRSMNQGKLEVVKQEMARVNVNILGISELKWTGMGKFNSFQFNCSVMSNSWQLNELRHARPPCLSPTSRVYPNLCLKWWCHPAISSSVIPYPLSLNVSQH